MLAKHALSQLSYSPTISVCLRLLMVGLGRVELPTSPLSGVRSNQLSYRPKLVSNRAVSPAGLDHTARSPAARTNSHSLLMGFEDKVEHADRLRRSRPS